MGGEPRGGLGFGERAEGERLGEGGGDAASALISRGGKAREDGVAPDQRALRMADGIEPRRGLREACKQGALGEREVGEGFLEVETRGFGGADAEISVVEAVQVGAENLVFRPSHFQTAGGESFVEFSERTAFRGRRRDFHQLLGDGGRAGNHPPLGEEITARPQRGERVDPAVSVKPLVLRGDRAGDEIGGNFIQRDRRSARRVRQREMQDRRAMAVEQLRRGGGIFEQAVGQRNGEWQREPAEQDRHGRTSSADDPSLPFGFRFQARHHAGEAGKINEKFTVGKAAEFRSYPQHMKKQLFLWSCAAGLMLMPAGAAEKEESPLAKQMESMNDAYKGFRRETDPVKGAAQAREAQQAALKSALETPEMLKAMPEGPAKVKALLEYRKMLGKLFVTFCEVEEAFLNGKMDEVEKIVAAIKEMKKAGHDKFMEEEE